MTFVLGQYTGLRADSARGLAEGVEAMVLEGSLAPGDRLPPVRELAGTVGLSANTVAAAYRLLGNRGVVVGRGRLGTFVTPRPAGPALDTLPDPALVDLASGNPDPALLPDLGAYLAGIDPGRRLYGGPAVDPELEPVARRLLEDAGVPVERLAVVGGAMDGVERAFQAQLAPGDAVAVEAPGWPPLSDLIVSMGLRPVPVPIDDSGMLPGRLEAVAGGVGAVLVTPRLQNPTGAATDPARAAELRQVLDRHPGVFVVEDDHGALVSGIPLASVATGRERWAYIQSMSKPLGPDLRLAFLTGDDVTVGRLAGRQGVGPGWVSHILQRLVAAVLADPATDVLLARAVAAYAERRDALIGALAARGIGSMGRSGLNVWVPVPDDDAAVAALAAEGYAVRSGARWRMGTPPAIRVSTARATPDLLERVADHIAAVVSPPTSPGDIRCA